MADPRPAASEPDASSSTVLRLRDDIRLLETAAHGSLPHDDLRLIEWEDVHGISVLAQFAHLLRTGLIRRSAYDASAATLKAEKLQRFGVGEQLRTDQNISRYPLIRSPLHDAVYRRAHEMRAIDWIELRSVAPAVAYEVWQRTGSQE